ncbi:MAG: aminoacyl-tRNA hydrolase [Pseudomonadota bacterium]
MSDSSLQLIVGLGNPGAKYEATRHNAGFWFVDELVRRHGGRFVQQDKFHGQVCRLSIDGTDVWVLRPDTYMNESGRAVRALMQYYKIPIDNVLVAYDEIDLPPGKVKLKLGGGHGGHNGIRDIISHESAGFMRLRLGVGHPGDKSLVVNYVLGVPGRKEAELVDQTIERGLDVVPLLVTDGVQKATHVLHSNRASATVNDDIPRKRKARDKGETPAPTPKRKPKSTKTVKPSRRDGEDLSNESESLKDQLLALFKRKS